VQFGLQLENGMTVQGGYAAGEVCGEMSTPRLRYGIVGVPAKSNDFVGRGGATE